MLRQERAEFDAFLAKHEKTLRYASDPREYVHRLRVFASNLAAARERERDDRANGGTATHGVTKFMDLTPEEFRETYLGSKMDVDALDALRSKRKEKAIDAISAMPWTIGHGHPASQQEQGGHSAEQRSNDERAAAERHQQEEGTHHP